MGRLNYSFNDKYLLTLRCVAMDIQLLARVIHEVLFLPLLCLVIQ